MVPWPSPDTKQPSSIEEMASAIIVQIKRIQSNGSYALAAYSSGGIVPFEIANQLTDSGDSMSYLGLIDTNPTTLQNSETEIFLFSLSIDFPEFELFNDSTWWTRYVRQT